MEKFELREARRYGRHWMVMSFCTRYSISKSGAVTRKVTSLNEVIKAAYMQFGLPGVNFSSKSLGRCGISREGRFSRAGCSAKL